MRIFNKIFLIVIFYCLLLNTGVFAQTQAIDVDGDGKKEIIKIETETVGNNIRGMIYVFKDGKNIFPASIENGYSSMNSFHQIINDPENPNQKMILIVSYSGEWIKINKQADRKVRCLASVFQILPGTYFFHETYNITTKNYYFEPRFSRNQDSKKIRSIIMLREAKITQDILEQMKNNQYRIRRASRNNFIFKSSEEKILNNFILAAKNGDHKKTKSFLGYMGGPGEKPDDFDRSVDRVIDIIKNNQLLIIETNKYPNGSVRFILYFHYNENYLIPKEPYINLYLGKKEKTFSYCINAI